MKDNVISINGNKKSGNSNDNTSRVANILDKLISQNKMDYDLKSIFSNWSTLERLCLEITRYVTDIVPSIDEDEKPLLLKCIKNAIDGWYQAEQAQSEPIECYREFIRGLLNSIPEVLETAVYVTESNGASKCIWDPCDGPLYPWLKEKGRKVKIMRRKRPWDTFAENIDKADFRALVLYKIVKGIDLNTLHTSVNYVVGKTPSPQQAV